MQTVADKKTRRFRDCIDLYFIGIENQGDIEEAKRKLKEVEKALLKLNRIEDTKLQST